MGDLPDVTGRNQCLIKAGMCSEALWHCESLRLSNKDGVRAPLAKTLKETSLRSKLECTQKHCGIASL